MGRYIDIDAIIEEAHRQRKSMVTVELLENMPTVDVPKWIPCSERLPNEGEYVLATTDWDEITIAEKIGNDMWFIHEGNTNATTEDIIAWMPLPESWKGEEDEQTH